MGVRRHALLLSVTLVFTFAACVNAAPQTTGNAVDIRQAAKHLVQDIRRVVATAKNGQYVYLLYENVLGLESSATQLLENLPGDVSECETNSVIKMAAAGTGSHEVLTVMLAQDAMSVLNGRLALSLAFLEHLAGQLEDEATLVTGDIGPHVSAIAFGANTTASIIETADKAVKAVLPATPSNKKDSDHHNRVRRQSIDIGSGWSVGLKGVKWESSSGMTTFTVKPKFTGFKPSGVKATLIIRF